jgi:hypothetical protein
VRRLTLWSPNRDKESAPSRSRPFRLSFASYRGSLRVALRRKARAVLPSVEAVCTGCWVEKIMEPAIMPTRNAPAKMSIIRPTGRGTVETVSSAGTGVPGRGGSYAPRPGLAACKYSMTPPSVPPFRDDESGQNSYNVQTVVVLHCTRAMRQRGSLKQALKTRQLRVWNNKPSLKL